MLLRRVDARVDEPQQSIDVEPRADGRRERDPVRDEVDELDHRLQVDVAAEHALALPRREELLRLPCLVRRQLLEVLLAIAVGFTAGAIAFSAAALRRPNAGEEKRDAVPARDLATVLPAEAGAD